MRLSALICLSLSSIAAVAAPQVQVVGLFPGAAVLNIDGQRKLVKVGQSGPEGVQVVSADSHKAHSVGQSRSRMPMGLSSRISLS